MAPAYAVPRLLARTGRPCRTSTSTRSTRRSRRRCSCTLKAWEDPDFCGSVSALDAPLGSIDRGRLNVNGLARRRPSVRRDGRSHRGSLSRRSSSRPAEAEGSSRSARPAGRASSRSSRHEHDRPLHDHRQLARGPKVSAPTADPAAPLRARYAALRGAGARRGRRAFATGIAAWLGGEGVAAVSTLPDSGDKVGAVVLDLSAATDPAELDQLRLLGAPAVKALRRNGRVVVIGTDPATLTDVAEVTTQRALEGAVRSIGKELRSGATANLVLAQGDARDGVRSAVEFFLSGTLGLRRRPGGPGRRVHERRRRRAATARRQGGRRDRRRTRHSCRDRPRAGP